jgi:hypothetical protein
MDVDAVAGSHIDEVLEACAVPRYLVRVVCLDGGGRSLLVAVICACSSSFTSAISFRGPVSRDGEPGCWIGGPANAALGEMAPAHVSASPPATPMVTGHVVAT